jgi:hypothetical protein
MEKPGKLEVDPEERNAKELAQLLLDQIDKEDSEFARQLQNLFDQEAAREISQRPENDF